MRIALVSPYSWTYPGGVTRHIEALAERAPREGHDVRVLAPYDPPDRARARLHRGARPQRRELPDYLVPLGRTIGFPANGAVSNLAPTPSARHDAAPRARAGRLRRRPRARAGRAGRRLGRARLRRAAARRDLPLLLDEPASATTSRTLLGARRLLNQPARAHRRLGGGRVDRRGASSAATTGSSPTASTSTGGAPARERAATGTARCGSRSSARRSSARACRSCCARSRRCASTCRPS